MAEDKKWDFEVGDIIFLGKPHPCGSHEWEILRVGMDFRLKCLKCGRQVQLLRGEVEKRCRRIVKTGGSPQEGSQ